MSVSKLKPYFEDDILDASFNKPQLDELYEVFKEHFVFDPFEIDGKRIKIIHQKSRVKQYSEYSETFAHIISRKTYILDARIYECQRANRIHWIRPVLQSHPCKDIFYYRWKDDEGVCKHHYWLFDKNFMVVTVDVKPDLRIVTTFCVDNDQKSKFYERYKNFQEGEDCL
ncbi:MULTISPECIES: hypothetical protein [Pedobacter]|jgi:transglutaminase-like putative cysteine protease|uniref:Uncharacterized protein n=2 Tax=Pedobacter TaxID=84567 RepID=A0A4U1CNV0_9SPHI|nr:MULTISPECIES: hypothetical protein [Pedobacter]TKC08926.1 hypothetical protein FA047_02185 [Pedobacter frigoris]SDF99367.1 hypothetical protein SAMN05421827_102345 [Pedobacter terrae]